MRSKKNGCGCLGLCVLTTILCLPFSSVEAADQLKIMSFNVWTVENTQSGRNTIVDIVNTSGADVVGFQELSNATQIAVSLGWYLHQNGEKPIMSRYPIVANSHGGLGARIALPGGAYAWVFNVHLPAYPYEPYDLRDGKLAKNEAAVIASANNTDRKRVV